MKTTLILVLLLFLLPLTTIADDNPTEDFFGGGGPMPTLMFLDLEDLNSAITSAGYPQLTQVF